MNDHEKVLPCPFCGSENISDGEMLTEKDCGTRVKQSQCNECGAFGPEAVTDGPDYGDVRAIAAWNRRAAIEVMEGKGEVVGEVGTGWAGPVRCVQWYGLPPPSGTKLYTTPQQPAQDAAPQQAGWEDGVEVAPLSVELEIEAALGHAGRTSERLMRMAAEAKALLHRAETAEAKLREESARLDYIERTFSGMTNRERYLPVQMIWGKGCNGRTLREACDKYRKRDAAIGGTGDA